MKHQPSTALALALALVGSSLLACGGPQKGTNDDEANAAAARQTRDAACAPGGDDAPSRNTPDAGDADAGDAGSGDADAGGSGAPAATPLSNLPGLTFVNESAAEHAGLVLRSSNLESLASSPDRYARFWRGAIRNEGRTTLCTVSIEASALDATGRPLMTFEAFVDAEPYGTGPTSEVTPCIAPGASGFFEAVQFGDARVPAATIRALEYKAKGYDVGDRRPHPAAPTLATKLSDPAAAPQVTIAVTAVADIHDPHVVAYGLDPAGLVVDVADERSGVTIRAGTTREISPYFKSRVLGIARTATFVPFLPGARPEDGPGPSGLSNEERAVLARRERARSNGPRSLL